MTYFKVISGGKAVDAGCMWLVWNKRHNCLMACEPNEAHYAQNYNSTKVYRIEWLNPLPDGAPTYPLAEAKMIEWEEYDELVAILDDGETVPEPPEPEPEPEPDPTPDPEPSPEPERPMSVKEMREKISELTAAVLNESLPFTAEQTYKDGEVIVNGSRVYIANQVIVDGETVIPGSNCTETTIANVLNSIQSQQE